MYETLTIETDDRGVATLWLDRPDKHNAMNAAMIRELQVAAKALDADDRIRVVVISGRGKSFCAGGDLRWMQEQMASTSEERRQGAKELAGALFALNTLSKPLIARVNGNAFGGGIGLMSVADLVIAADGARFGLTEVRLGLIPATISPYVLARMGETHARKVFMSGRLFDASEAEGLNLVARVCPPDQLDQAIDAEVEPYLSAAPQAVAAAKRLTRMMGAAINGDVIETTAEALVQTWEGDEAAEGIAAFFEKRAPRWAQ